MNYPQIYTPFARRSPYDYESEYPYYNSFTSPLIAENAESVLAKINPKKAFKLLDDYSERKHQERVNEIGASVLNTYLSGLNSEDRVELRECRFEQIENRNIFGRVTRRGMKFVFVR